MKTRIATFRRTNRAFGYRIREVATGTVVGFCLHDHRTRDAAMACARHNNSHREREHPDARAMTADEIRERDLKLVRG
jgi:hypothetical protein